MTLNQFPCDEESRKKRYDLLKERYPFCEYLSFAIIGDDDLLSAEFATDYWAWPIVIEKDNRINRAIKKTNPRVRIVEEDVVLIPSKRLPPIKTFITDPPYTLHGSLSFILAGLSMLEKTNDLKEFYVVLNSTMLGKHLEKIQRILSKNNVLLHDVRMNFSHYRFPKHFSERRQANAWLEKNGINSSCLQYSSSSNLYIFRTRKPNLRKISEFIDPKKIYNHYL